MPQMADLSLGNGTTADTFAALTPSAGDKVPARWRFEDTTVPAGCRETVEMISRWNGKRDARHVDLKLVMPYVITETSGLKTVVANVLFTGQFVVPVMVPDSMLTRARYRLANMYHQAALTCVSGTTGYAPT